MRKIIELPRVVNHMSKVDFPGMNADLKKLRCVNVYVVILAFQTDESFGHVSALFH